MRKVSIWITVISAVIVVMAWAVMGIGVYEMEPETISITAYIALPFLILMFAGLLYIRWSSAKCPHCGKVQLVNGKFCPYCGKERKG